ncbi:MAG: hypothetical protein GWO02_17580, partial [Gammaproteobacteria bacterium]|nr:hypothetical protein [Gammaproteobacteria bacterium]
TIREFTGKAGAPAAPSGGGGFFAQMFGGGGGGFTVKAGLNTFVWSRREEGPTIPSDVTLWGFAPGREVPPGTYKVRLEAGDWSEEQELVIALNPKIGQTAEGAAEQYELLGEIGDMIDDLYDGLGRLRDVKKQSAAAIERVRSAGVDHEDVAAAATAMRDKLTVIEEQITQVKSKSGQDPINFPPMLDNQVVNLYMYALGGFGGGDNRPTDAAYERLEDLRPQVADLLGQIDAVITADLAAFNDLVASKALPAVVVGDT